MTPTSETFTHDDARRVLWLRAHEQHGHAAEWREEDRQWATARAAEADATTADGFLIDRAQHAWARLAERAPHPGARLASLGHASSAWLAGALGLACGTLADQVGSAQHVHVLAAPGWALLLWNLLLVAGFVAWRLCRALRRPAVCAPVMPGLAERWWAHAVARSGKAAATVSEQAFARDWQRATAPLLAPRLAAALHAAAAGLALGVVLSLYARGLVTDYRVGWQSTFLEAGAVQTIVNVVLAPASFLSGIAVPEVAALRVSAGQAPQGLAAPWLHLQALTLLLLVALPRTALATVASVRARGLAQRLQLPLHEPYFQQLLAAWPAGQRRPIALVLLGLPSDVAAAWQALLQAQPELQVQPQAPPSAEFVQALLEADAKLARGWWPLPWRKPRPAPELAPWLALREQAEVLLLSVDAFASPAVQTEFTRWWAKPVWVLDGLPPLPWWPLEEGQWRALQQLVPVSRRMPLVKLMARRQTTLESSLEEAIEALAAELAQHALQHLQRQPEPASEAAVATRRVPEARAGLLGGVVSGTMVGLGADLAGGGLTMGSGALVGGLVGALGGVGAAKGWNRRHAAPLPAAMPAEQLQQWARAGLLHLVARLHAPVPDAAVHRQATATEAQLNAWGAQLQAQQQRHAAAWHALWNSRPLPQAELQRALAPLLASCLESTLRALHPSGH